MAAPAQPLALLRAAVHPRLFPSAGAVISLPGFPVLWAHLLMKRISPDGEELGEEGEQKVFKGQACRHTPILSLATGQNSVHPVSRLQEMLGGLAVGRQGSGMHSPFLESLKGARCGAKGGGFDWHPRCAESIRQLSGSQVRRSGALCTPHSDHSLIRDQVGAPGHSPLPAPGSWRGTRPLQSALGGRGALWGLR